jgi:hypothetical protein
MNYSETRHRSVFLPDTPSFSGHETFTFRYPWLKKGLDGLSKNSSVFQSDDAIVELGVGKNMVTSIRHWSLATGVIEEKEPESGERRRTLGVSPFGMNLLADSGWDPYLEDDTTLWLLHWKLVTNPDRATTWFFVFHLFLEPEFTRQTLLDEINRVAEEKRWARVSENTLENDISCFIRTYIPVKRGATSTLEDSLDCPLTQLGVIVTYEDSELFRFNNQPKTSLPPELFAYALVDYWYRYHNEQNTLSVREIIHSVGSPGRAFRLDEDGVLGYLDRLAELTDGKLTFEDTALVRQVVRRQSIDPTSLLNRYYGRHE